MIGAMTFGRTSTNMIRQSPAPSERAGLDELPLPQRQHLPPDDPRDGAQLNALIAMIATDRLGPVTETSEIANNRNGNDSTTSTSRARSVSTSPPK